MTEFNTDPPTGPSANEDAVHLPPVQIRSALVAGVERRRRRAHVRVAFAGGVAVAIAAAGLAGGLLSQGPAPAVASALAIKPDGGRIEVQIVNEEAKERQMTEELHAAGIEAEVKVIPTIPGRVGEWLGLQKVTSSPPEKTRRPSVAPRPAQVWNPNDIAADRGLLSIRREALRRLDDARWVFYIGRAPRQGEAPQVLFEDGPRRVGPRWNRHVEAMRQP